VKLLDTIRFLPAGDRGLIVELGNEISLEINARVRALAVGIEAASIPGLTEVIPTYRSVGVELDPLVTSFDEMQARIRDVAAHLDPCGLTTPKLVRVPTVYGGEYGPDLPFVAGHAGLSPAEVIQGHSRVRYHVYMIGFTPGYVYLGGLPERLHTPRLPSPRIRVPRGSVAIGGAQTGIYSVESPGGWRLIGRTSMNLFDPTREIPTPIVPGDAVEFVPTTEADFLGAEPRDPLRPERAKCDGCPSAGLDEPRAASRDMREVNRGGTRRSGLGAIDSIEVVRPGLLTTVQDRGRFGYQKFGVPANGAVDGVALRVANVLVGNPQGAAALEVTVLGPQLRFLADAVVAVTGAEVQADLDGRPVPWYQSFLVRAGQTLDVQACARGLRSYLAVAGGMDVPVLLGSRSTCLAATFGGFQGRALAAGDLLRTGPTPGPLTALANREVPEEWRRRPSSPVTLRVVLGPQDDAFTEQGVRTFLESPYQVTQHTDRMGCRLDGPEIAHRKSADIISDWVPTGGVQVPGDRRPIILLADRQTTGGYPKIATVIGSDLPLVAQCRPGDSLRFRAVTLAEALAITREIEADLEALPRRLVGPDGFSIAAEVGEVPGMIPLSPGEGGASGIGDRG
jgi:KipI family sensor histidine kinase inhibitor